jgi:hypothetical protein
MRNFARDMIRMLPVVVVTVIVFLTILFIAMPKQNPYLKAEEPDYTGVSDVISLQKVNTGEVRASNIRQENYLTINSAYITHNINLLVYRILISIYRNLEDDPVIQYLSKVYPDFNQFFDNMKGKMYLEKFLIRTEDKIEIIDKIGRAHV